MSICVCWGGGVYIDDKGLFVGMMEREREREKEIVGGSLRRDDREKQKGQESNSEVNREIYGWREGARG